MTFGHPWGHIIPVCDALDYLQSLSEVNEWMHKWADSLFMLEG